MGESSLLSTSPLSTSTDPTLHLWTRADYHRMAESGLFAGKRVQLIRGQVIEMSPMRSRHATGIELVNQALRARLGSQGYVREQKPLALGIQSEPEPDIAVVTGSPRDYAQAHPTTAQLVVEVSDSTLKFDQQVKGPLYAEAGIPEYWILNLVENTLEVYRDPTPSGYQTKQVWGCQDRVLSLVEPNQGIPVLELLP